MTIPVVGDVRERLESSFEWRIRNWKLLLTEKHDIIQSQTFKFLDATFHLEIQNDNDSDTVWFFVVRDKGMQNWQVAAYKISARKSDGIEYEIDKDEFECTEEEEEEERDKSCFSHIERELIFNNLAHDENLTVTFSLSGNRSAPNEAVQSISSEYEEVCTKETETEDTEGQVKSDKRSVKDFEKLSRNFKDLWVTGQGSDVTVKVNDREFPVHKMILSARSPVFDKMFSHDMVEREEGVVVIKDCCPDAFKEFLLYLYSGELVEFSRKTVFDLYMLSDKYDVPELKSASVEFIAEDLCMDNFSDVVHLALQQSESVLLEKATKFFAKNLKNIIVSAKWQSFITENPIQANELYIKALNDLLPE